MTLRIGKGGKEQGGRTIEGIIECRWTGKKNPKDDSDDDCCHAKNDQQLNVNQRSTLVRLLTKRHYGGVQPHVQKLQESRPRSQRELSFLYRAPRINHSLHSCCEEVGA